MRYIEIKLHETAIAKFQVGPYQLEIMTHIKDRLKDRKLKPWHLANIVSQIPSIKDEIDNVETGYSFFIVNKKLKVSLGVTKKSDSILQARTIIDTDTPYAKNVNTIIYV